MIDFLRTWVKDIFIIVVGLYFIEIVLPEGTMRKYIKFILSIMVLGVVISPLSNLGSLGAVLEAEELQIQNDYEAVGADVATDLEEVQWIQMEEVYRMKLQEQVEMILSENFPRIEILGIDVALQEHSDENDFGKVKKIVIKTAANEYVNSIKDRVSQGLGIQIEKIEVEEVAEAEQASAEKERKHTAP